MLKLRVDFEKNCKGNARFICTDRKDREHKNNAIDSVKAAVENGELSISTANEIAKHNTTKQQEIISSPIEKLKQLTSAA